MKSVLNGAVCLLLLATAALGQASSPAPSLKARPSESNELIPNSNVAPDAPVITIQGLCEKPPNSNATPAECSTVITRTEFEKLINAVQPNMPPANRKAFATRYVTVLVLSEKAHEMGLDKGPEFDEQMYIARMQILARLAAGQMQHDAANVPDSQINDYYQQHQNDYKTVSFERIFVPKQKEDTAGPPKSASAKNDSNSEAEMKDEADKLRARAAAGEDPVKLQQEANDFAGNKTKVTNVKAEDVRKPNIPPTDAAIFDLKAGEVSPVFSDPTGYRIYKVEEIKALPLASVHEEIARALQGQNMKNAFDSLENSAKPTFDNAYFANPGAPTLRNPGEHPASPAATPPPGQK